VTISGPGTTGGVTFSYTAGDGAAKVRGTINGHKVALLD
jgi:hypothetical protein